MGSKRNRHEWKSEDAEGRRRILRAQYFGKRWSWRALGAEDEDWVDLEEPTLEDLVELRLILFNKYQRHRVSWDLVASVEKQILDRGGSWEQE